MKRKLLTITISISMLIGMASMTAFAETETSYIENMEQFKATLTHSLSVAEQDKLIQNTNEQILVDFMEEKFDKVVEIINGQNINTDMQIMSDGTSYGIQNFDLGDGCVMTVEVSDRADEAGIATRKDVLAVSSNNDPWYAYGNRSYTAKATVHFGGAKACLNLRNNYKLSANGIDEEKGNASCSWELSKGQITHGTPNISDSVARTPGASDVNTYCLYTLIGDGSSGTISKAKYKLNTTIGYVAINKTEKKIKVRPSWSLEKVS